MNKTLIIVVGPTAIGKTALSISLAQKFGTEIISADSRQFYKEMNVGTAKPSPAELSAIHHHFINSRGVTEPFSVGDFANHALGVLDRLFQDYDVAILVGGSGLYIDALCYGFDEIPKPVIAVREQLNEQYASEGIHPLQQELKSVDPEYYAQVDLSNPQRLIRALEVWRSTGKPISSFQKSTQQKRPFETIWIGLNTERQELYKRIDSRVDDMIAAELETEVRSLVQFKHLNALKTVGYSEFFDYFDGKLSFSQAVERIKQNTRRYAKRQLTWFRKNEKTKWFEPGELPEIISFINDKLLN